MSKPYVFNCKAGHMRHVVLCVTHHLGKLNILNKLFFNFLTALGSYVPDMDNGDLCSAHHLNMINICSKLFIYIIPLVVEELWNGHKI